ADENEDRDWNEMLWSDEATFKTGERPGRKLVTHVTFRSGRKSLMVWACIANNKPEPILHLQTTPEVIDEKGKKKGGGINGERYVEQVLEDLMKD
ncbi:hypothetical protein BDY19DRAFT_900955, partial [Irpex rosettiformis]